MKKIVYIGGFELPNKNAAAQRVTSNAKILQSIGFSTLIMGVDKKQSFDSGLLDLDNDYGNIDFASVSYPKKRTEWIISLYGRKEIFDYLKNNSEYIDAIILYNYSALASYRINSMFKKSKIKVYFDITEWYSSSGESLIFKVAKWLDTNLRIRFVAFMGTGVITTSQFLTDFYRDKGVEVLELPTLYDVDALPKKKIQVKSKTQLTNLVDKKTKFIYFGSPFNTDRAIKSRSSIKERLDVLIEALSAMKSSNHYSLDIYGVSQEDYLKVYPEHYEIINSLLNKVFFHGKIPHDRLLSKIQECDYTVFFRDETLVNLAGFPSKMAESISLGVPVITNVLPNLRKYANCSGVYFCKHGEEAKLLEKMMEQKMPCEVSKNYFDYRNYINISGEFFKI